MNYKDNKIKVPRFKEENGFYTTKKRSRIMSKIKATETKPEVKFRKALWHAGYRYLKNYKKLKGKPDIVLKKYNTIIFIDGEFWHGYNWEQKKDKIKSNRKFWIPKIERNMQRDKEVTQYLEERGYTVFRFWQHEIKKEFEKSLNLVINHLEGVP